MDLASPAASQAAVYANGLKYSVLIFVEKIYKMRHLEGSGTPVLYIGRTVSKG